MAKAKKKISVQRIPITKARTNLAEVTQRAHRNNEVFIIEKDGVAIAGIMSADEIEDYLELNDPVVKRIIKRGHEDYQAGKTRPAEELLAELEATTRRRSGNAKKPRGGPRKKDA